MSKKQGEETGKLRLSRVTLPIEKNPFPGYKDIVKNGIRFSIAYFRDGACRYFRL